MCIEHYFTVLATLLYIYIYIELFLANVRRDLINSENIRQARDNLSKKERAALKELKNDSNVVTRIQDKGS